LRETVIRMPLVPRKVRWFFKGLHGFYIGVKTPIIQPRFNIGYLTQGVLVFLLVSVYENRSSLVQWIKSGKKAPLTLSPDSDDNIESDDGELSTSESSGTGGE